MSCLQHMGCKHGRGSLRDRVCLHQTCSMQADPIFASNTRDVDDAAVKRKSPQACTLGTAFHSLASNVSILHKRSETRSASTSRSVCRTIFFFWYTCRPAIHSQVNTASCNHILELAPQPNWLSIQYGWLLNIESKS